VLARLRGMTLQKKTSQQGLQTRLMEPRHRVVNVAELKVA